MNVLSLFAGIGGFDLGLERAGMTVVGQCEIDPYCRAVLAKHWPDVPQWEDVLDVTGDSVRSRCGLVDVVCGGFPCQDISSVGKRRGIDGGGRSGLWREFSRIIAEVRPQYALVENVSALLEWDLGTVLADLARIGFDAEWEHLPAGALGAPHLRRRIFVVAYPSAHNRTSAVLSRSTVRLPPIFGRKPRGGFGCEVPASYWQEDQPGLVEVDDGLSSWSREVGAYGNAVVPQVAEVIGRAIMAAAAPSPLPARGAKGGEPC